MSHINRLAFIRYAAVTEHPAFLDQGCPRVLVTIGGEAVFEGSLGIAGEMDAVKQAHPLVNIALGEDIDHQLR